MTTATTTAATATDDKVLVGLVHADDEPENVLIAYLVGVEALRVGKQAALWLTKEGVRLASKGFAETIDVPGAPDVAALHDEFVERGGRLIACPVCVRLRDLQDEPLADNAVIGGVPAVFEFTAGGAMVFNY